MIKSDIIKVSDVPPEYIANEVYNRVTRLIHESKRPVFEFLKDHVTDAALIHFWFTLYGPPDKRVGYHFAVYADEPARGAILRGSREVASWLIRLGHCTNRTSRN